MLVTSLSPARISHRSPLSQRNRNHSSVVLSASAVFFVTSAAWRNRAMRLRASQLQVGRLSGLSPNCNNLRVKEIPASVTLPTVRDQMTMI